MPFTIRGDLSLLDFLELFRSFISNNVTQVCDLLVKEGFLKVISLLGPRKTVCNLDQPFFIDKDVEWLDITNFSVFKVHN